MKTALVTGITGQVGSFLAELLLERGDYYVHGLTRRASTPNTARIDHIVERLTLHYADLNDGTNLSRLMEKIRPDEAYHLGAQSHVKVSFDVPEYTFDVGATGTIRLLEAIRNAGLTHTTRFYNAASSEMFGGRNCPLTGFTEESPFLPRSPYGAAKLAAYWATRNYREAYGLFAASGLIFNSESLRRGDTFVTRKIARAVARIEYGLQEGLLLGNMKASRDWIHARDAAEAMYLILQQENPEDFVIASGVSRTVEDFCRMAFEYRGIDNWKDLIEFDPSMLRPSEVDFLLGDSTKARTKLGWVPKTSLEEIVVEMVDHEISLIEDGSAL